jgi:Tfp pilus assembly protein PilN
MLQSRPLDLDILPEQHRPRRIAAAVAVGLVLAVALLLGLIPVYGVLTTQQARTANAEVDQEEIENVGNQIEEVRALIIRLQAEAGTLGQERTYRSDGIAAAVSSLVPRINVTAITQEENVFTVSGEAGSQALVLDYARALQVSGEFVNVFILSMINVDPLGMAPDVQFSITMEQ